MAMPRIPGPLWVTQLAGRAARQREREEAQQDPFRRQLSLPDPHWAALFQALAEQGVGRLVGGESGGDSNQFRGQPVQSMTTLDYEPRPAGYTQGAFTRSIDEAARQAATGGALQLPTYFAGTSPGVQGEFRRRFGGAMRGLQSELAEQRGIASAQALADARDRRRRVGSQFGR